MLQTTNINNDIKADEVLDVTGLTCPKPLLNTKKKLSLMAHQKILRVKLDDKKSLEDFEFFCKATGHILLKIEYNEPIDVYIRVK